jgi:hypothetical protein
MKRIAAVFVAAAALIAWGGRAYSTTAEVDTQLECADGKMVVTFTIHNQYLRPLEVVGYGLLANQPAGHLLARQDIDYRDARWVAVIATSGQYQWGVNYNDPTMHAQVNSTGTHTLTIDVSECAPTTTTGAETTTTVKATTTTSSPTVTSTSVAPTTAVEVQSTTTSSAYVPTYRISECADCAVGDSTITARVLPATGGGQGYAFYAAGLFALGVLLALIPVFAPRRTRK